LDAPTTFAQLRELVVQPVLAILNGKDADDALNAAAGVMQIRQNDREFFLDE
jgi:hypothetical protein